MKERIYVYLFRVVLKIFFELRKQKILYYKRSCPFLRPGEYYILLNLVRIYTLLLFSNATCLICSSEQY